MPTTLAGFELDELKRQPDKDIDGDCWCAKDEMKGVAERIEKRVENSRERVQDAMEDATRTAERLLKLGRNTCEDVLDNTTHQVKKFPIPALGVAFAAGALLGVLIPHKKT